MGGRGASRQIGAGSGVAGPQVTPGMQDAQRSRGEEPVKKGQRKGDVAVGSCRVSVGRLIMLKASRAALVGTLVLAGIRTVPARADTLPPDGINYQGVLRDQNNNPLTGT